MSPESRAAMRTFLGLALVPFIGASAAPQTSVLVAADRSPSQSARTSVQVEPVTALSPVVRAEIRDSNNGPVVATAPAGIIAHDFVTVSGGGPTPTGTIDFTFFTASAACSGASSTESGVALTPGGGVANSGPHGPLAAGSYSFLAHYGGDALYAPADSLCAPLEVIPGNPAPRAETRDHNNRPHTATTTVRTRAREHD